MASQQLRSTQHLQHSLQRKGLQGTAFTKHGSRPHLQQQQQLDCRSLRRNRTALLVLDVAQTHAGHRATGNGVPAAHTLQQSTTVSRPDCELSQLREEVSELRQLIKSQQQLVQQQALTIQELKQVIKDQPRVLTPPSYRSQTLSPFEAQRAAIGDRRYLGLYDARFHSTNWGATPRDHRVLPRRIILVRHAQSEGNVDNFAYTYVPDPQVPLTEYGMQQALDAGRKIKCVLDADEEPYSLYFYMSPYKRSKQTYEAVRSAFTLEQVKGAQEEVQLREQDFGNFQDAAGKQKEKAERLRFGRFFYRFPNGESGADVYDRMTIFEDHLIRDINAGRFSQNTSLVLVTHGLALRVFLMRWLHWTVDQFMEVFNPPNAEPLVLERVPDDKAAERDGLPSWIHTKALYRLTEESREIMKGCTDEMCSTSFLPREIYCRVDK